MARRQSAGARPSPPPGRPRTRSRAGRRPFSDRIGALLGAIPRIPEELANAAAVVSRDVNSGRPGLVIGILAVLIAVGFGAEWLVRRVLARAPKPTEGDGAGQAMLSEIAALSTFALASVGSFLAFEWPPLLRKIVLTLLLAFIVFRVVRVDRQIAVGLRRRQQARSEQPTRRSRQRSAFRFWLRRVGLVAGFLLFGWAIVSLMPALSFSIDVTRLAAFLFGLGILATAIEVVWRRPGRPRFAGRQVAAHPLPGRALAGLGGRACSACCGSAFLRSSCRRRCAASAT